MRAAWEFVVLAHSLSNGMAAAANLTNAIDVTPTTLHYGRLIRTSETPVMGGRAFLPYRKNLFLPTIAWGLPGVTLH